MEISGDITSRSKKAEFKYRFGNFQVIVLNKLKRL